MHSEFAIAAAAAVAVHDDVLSVPGSNGFAIMPKKLAEASKYLWHGIIENSN